MDQPLSPQGQVTSAIPEVRPRRIPDLIRLLSIDGGGIQGLAALVTIRELMHRIQAELCLPIMPLPCDYFDLIMGTGIGGLIAIMLGRLRMSVDEAMDWFQELVSLVFSKRKRWGDGTFKARNLELVVGRMVLKHTGRADAPMVDRTAKGCKTVVCAKAARAMRGVTLFRSYLSSENQAPDCTVVQAVRATTARPGLFKPAKIDHHSVPLLFVDAGLGCNNPAAHMLDEAKLVFRADQRVGCIISVGTGQTQPASMPAYKRIGWAISNDSARALQMIATDCEETAQRLQVRFSETPNVYFRFNIEQGLQNTGITEFEKLPEVVAHTRHNHQLVEVSAKLREAAKAAALGGTLIPTDRLDGAITRVVSKVRVKDCPPPSIDFTGRRSVLAQIEEYFLGDPGPKVQHVFVLHGLGGSGKTQIALKFVEKHREAFWDVFYIDASSDKTISVDLRAIASVKGAGSTTDDALTWLASQDEKWLIVFNNADDTSLDLRQYFPVCYHGDILITTRNHQMISIAGETQPSVKAERRISGMAPGDAKKLLLRTSGMAIDKTSGDCGATLVKELGYLALAIIQAGAYIRVHECTLEDYLKMFRENKMVLEEFRKIIPKPKDYSWTVYTTWRISYFRLKDRVAEFLRLLGFLHHEGITESMFQNACERLSSYPSELMSTAHELSIKQDVDEFLKSSFCATDRGGFSKSAFLEFIRELRSYSLIDFNPFDRTYSVHSLLQDWVRRVAVDTGSGSSHPSTAMLLALAIRYDPDSSRHATQRLLPHVDEVLANLQVMPCTANAFAWVYQQHNLWQSAEPLLSLSLDASKRILGEAHPTTIYNIENLATTLSRQERWPEAETLRQQAVEACQQTLGAEHTHTLWAMSNLAIHYSKQRRYQKAEDLQCRIVDAKKRAIGATHTDTLQAMGNLAIIYVDWGQLEKAIRLQEAVFQAFKQSRGPQHPDTLTSMQHLAITFAKEKRWDESTSLQSEVVDGRTAVFGRNHHDTRESIAILDQLQQNATTPRQVPKISITTDEELGSLPCHSGSEIGTTPSNLTLSTPELVYSPFASHDELSSRESDIAVQAVNDTATVLSTPDDDDCTASHLFKGSPYALPHL